MTPMVRINVGLTPAWAGTAAGEGSPICTARAHPRVGGDGSDRSMPRRTAAGSPPRGRGRLNAGLHRHAHGGLTPAWAGTARLRGPCWCRSRAHPRVGGDGGRTLRVARRLRGSPPRGRGRLLRRRGRRPVRGLTPAWGGDGNDAFRPGRFRAGSPPRGRGRPPVGWGLMGVTGLTPAWAGTARNRVTSPRPGRAHPRVGGDGFWKSLVSSGTMGSPPRGRGRLRRHSWRAGRQGAHPRVGGDGGDAMETPPSRSGSPPRGRGRPRTETEGFARAGLTPAWAGTARIPFGPGVGPRAHPRVGGDGSRMRPCRRRSPGSPPRGRGRPVVDASLLGSSGLTPAWAGTAHKWAGLGPRPGAHPRVGGDGRRFMGLLSGVKGSPPRGRGRHWHTMAEVEGRGLTPAWAGTASNGNGFMP